MSLRIYRAHHHQYLMSSVSVTVAMIFSKSQLVMPLAMFSIEHENQTALNKPFGQAVRSGSQSSVRLNYFGTFRECEIAPR